MFTIAGHTVSMYQKITLKWCHNSLAIIKYKIKPVPNYFTNIWFLQYDSFKDLFVTISDTPFQLFIRPRFIIMPAILYLSSEVTFNL